MAKRKNPDQDPSASSIRRSEVSSRETAQLDYAFQPIVNIHTGVCFGYEALLRNVEKTRFTGILEFFDGMHRQGMLPHIDAALREKAIAKFRTIPGSASVKLFYNLDKRVLEEAGVESRALIANIGRSLTRLGVHPASLVVELTERQEAGLKLDVREAVRGCRSEHFKLALDDFGTGVSGLQLLYHAEPDFIKIDRFFIQDIATDARKRLFVASMVNIAHTLGILVVAEGIETVREFYICRDIGCDLVQGYFVQRPVLDVNELKSVYPSVVEASQRDRRARNLSDQRFIADRVDVLDVIPVRTHMAEVLNRFRREKHAALFPVVNELNEPLGIIREAELKEIVYSQYGRELLKNKSSGMTVRRFVSKCPIADLNTKTEKILELFSRGESPEGVIIVRDMKYFGFLSASQLLKVIHGKSLELARDQSPLTRLPGNFMVYEYLQDAAQDLDESYVVAYLDFDHFKPFNDKYGFREGDRAILLFAELLKRDLLSESCFIGHIGGDDFFVGWRGGTPDLAIDRLLRVLAAFRRDVESFYDPEDRRNGYIVTEDRDGGMRRFPLLTTSVAVAHWSAAATPRSVEHLSRVIADLKKRAKSSPQHVCFANIDVAPAAAEPLLEGLPEPLRNTENLSASA
ncbi:MAG: EAL and GGDEF domain-containing protein [Planctomycetota bacterium]|nr:EAL and GGDEF domain-containing protein [Planctomycetota bacterium]